MTWKRSAIASVAILVAACLFLARTSFGRSSSRLPNVILISIDTLRSDHLGCYGYGKNTTPAIDAFRREAVLFRTAIASAPSTLPSHASIFTALAPQHHGASHTRSIPLAERFVTLTEVLRDAGYRTGAAVGGGQLAPEFGLSQGFESYEVVDDGTFRQVVGRAMPFIERVKERPFFLFLHSYEVHHPYWPSVDDARFDSSSETILPSYIDIRLLAQINSGDMFIGDADRAHIASSYDAEIASTDAAFRQLVATLKRLDLYDRSIIVFTSDHGEELGEHGFMGWHSHTLFDELLHVPLIVRFPAASHAGTEIGGVVRSIDVAPLILEAIGISRVPPFDHFSLATALARGRAPASEVLLWRETPPGDTLEHDGLRTADWKLIEGRLYDLRNDPKEQTDVAAAHGSVAADLTAHMQALLRERPRPNTAAIAPDPETEQKLRALGYLH
jgi:arylsulfatase A-like enzyme